MKTNFNILIFALLLGSALLASCNDDFMERFPENAISDGAVWKTPSDLQLYVNNFYNRDDLLPRYSGSGNVGIYTIDRDNGSDTQISKYLNSRMNGTAQIPSGNSGWSSGDWDELRDINYFFANYEKAQGDQKEINKYVGEALFFRAIFYFNKIRSYGDVPWYDQLLNPDDPELFNNRDPRNVVVDHLMTDLDRAVEYLPSRGEVAWNGRVNKETAMALQARIALYEGTWEKYHAGTPFGVSGSDGSKYLTKAKEVTDALIQLGTCDLDNKGTANGYQNVFNKESYAGSKEVLFWREYNLSLGVGNWWSDYSTYGAESGLTKRMVDMYLMNDGEPAQGHANYQGDATLLDVVANRDPRLNQTIFVNDGLHNHLLSMAGVMTPFKYPNFEVTDRGNITGYQLYKGHIPNPLLSNASGSQAMIYFRYAEALLINAEAKAELGTITQADLDNTVNQLRRRLVGMADMKLDAVNALPAGTRMFPALSNIINEIRRERAVELCCEGFRVDDIFRWAAADILIKNYVPKGAKRAQWESVKSIADGGDASNEFVAAVKALNIDEEGYIHPYKTLPAFPQTGYGFITTRNYLNALPSGQLVNFPNLKQNPGWE